MIRVNNLVDITDLRSVEFYDIILGLNPVEIRDEKPHYIKCELSEKDRWKLLKRLDKKMIYPKESA